MAVEAGAESQADQGVVGGVAEERGFSRIGIAFGCGIGGLEADPVKALAASVLVAGGDGGVPGRQAGLVDPGGKVASAHTGTAGGKAPTGQGSGRPREGGLAAVEAGFGVAEAEDLGGGNEDAATGDVIVDVGVEELGGEAKFRGEVA